MLIPRIELDAGRKPHIVRYTMSKKLRSIVQYRHSLFERVYPIPERLALRMLQVGYKQPSHFGRWCPVKVCPAEFSVNIFYLKLELTIYHKRSITAQVDENYTCIIAMFLMSFKVFYDIMYCDIVAEI